MNAIKFYGKEAYELVQVPLPSAGPGEVVLKVKAAAICGSDVRMIQNGAVGVTREHPRIYGHEIAGEIVDIGEGVTGYRTGMAVAAAPNAGCGTCDACVSGNTHQCINYQALGIQLDGGFAEYVRIPAAFVRQGNLAVIHAKTTMDFAKAAVAEPLSCVYNGFENVRIQPCDTVLIIGAGPIGLMHGMLAHMAGALKVILTDVKEERVRLCQEILPSLIGYSGSQLKEFIRDQTRGRGVDVCITACPSLQAQAEALELLAVNGRVNFFGGLPAGRDQVMIATNLIHYRQLTVTGSARASLTQYRKCLKLLEENRLELAPLISAVYDIREYKEAIQTAIAGKNLKNVFVFD